MRTLPASGPAHRRRKNRSKRSLGRNGQPASRFALTPTGAPTGTFADGGLASRLAKLWNWTAGSGFAGDVVGAGPGSGLAVTGVSGAMAPWKIASGAAAAAS